MSDEKVDNPQQRGRLWEVKVLKKLKELGYTKLARTQLVDKEADNNGIDIKANTNGKVSLNIQCKSSSKSVKYEQILTNMPQGGVTNVIFHEKFWKGDIVGEYAILKVEDFLTIVNR